MCLSANKDSSCCSCEHSPRPRAGPACLHPSYNSHLCIVALGRGSQLAPQVLHTGIWMHWKKFRLQDVEFQMKMRCVFTASLVLAAPARAWQRRCSSTGLNGCQASFGLVGRKESQGFWRLTASLFKSSVKWAGGRRWLSSGGGGWPSLGGQDSLGKACLALPFRGSFHLSRNVGTLYNLD